MEDFYFTGILRIINLSVMDSFSLLCVFQAVRPIAQAGNKNLEFSPLALFAYFVNRCRENLHIVVAFSPIGDAFRNRLRQFPSLINCCTINWFQVRTFSCKGSKCREWHW